MMKDVSLKPVKTVIVDDNEEALFELKDYLSFFPEIELIGTASKYVKARKLLLETKPELVFLDIEMPCKNGFELLHELREKGCDKLNVIFCTAYDQYVVQALRESAFDYILKPLNMDELKNSMTRFMKQRGSESILRPIPFIKSMGGSSQITALPTGTGIKFTDRNNIVLFQCLREPGCNKPNWYAFLNTLERIKLRSGIIASEILEILSDSSFVLVNQSAIVNLNYTVSIEFKTRECILIPPYDKINLSISRSQLSLLRERFEVF